MRVILHSGAPGVGKSETARGMVDRCTVKAAFIDIDTFGLVNHWKANHELYKLMAGNLEATLPNYLRWGAELAVVSGVMLPRRLLPFVEQAVETANLEISSIYGLTASQGEIRRRIVDDPKPQNVPERLRWTWLDAELSDIHGLSLLDSNGLSKESVIDRILDLERAGGHDYWS